MNKKDIRSKNPGFTGVFAIYTGKKRHFFGGSSPFDVLGLTILGGDAVFFVGSLPIGREIKEQDKSGGANAPPLLS